MADTVKSEVIVSESQGVVVVALGSPDEKMAVLNESRMDSLERAVESLAGRSDLKAIIFIGPHAHCFCAGADVSLIEKVQSADDGARLAKRGQDIFLAIERLQPFTVAAISGPCVGGGFEMSLACKGRIATDQSDTKIGLPEIKLGILPGFGGTQRLPRLVGLPTSLDIILKGKVVSARKALKSGLIDKVVKVRSDAHAELRKAAIDFALGKSRNQHRKGVVQWTLTHVPPARSYIKTQVIKSVMKETKGQYPAPLKAIESIFRGLESGLDAGYAFEAKALGELVVTAECKSLVHLFFLTEAASKLGRAQKDEVRQLRVGVIGAGVMGAGIAAALATRGFHVSVFEPNSEVRKRAEQSVTKSIEKQLKRLEPGQAIGSSRFLSDLDNLGNVGLVIEAVIEDEAIKHTIYEKLEALLSSDAIIATNTSSIPLSRLSSKLKSPARFIGMHFFNPAEKMPLVELIRCEQTSQASLEKTAAVVSALGKYPVVVSDVAGFLVNRILTPYLLEAAFSLKDGYSIAAIDQAGTQFGMPMGPLRLLDEVGLDLASKVPAILEAAYGERMSGPGYAQMLVDAGRLGKKNGLGFYRYFEDKSEIDPEVAKILCLTLTKEPTNSQGSEFSELTLRLVLPMVNEAFRCLEEGVAGENDANAMDQIDLATVMGLGFAPFRGGVMHFAKRFGLKNVEGELAELAIKYGSRFEPCAGLRKRA